VLGALAEFEHALISERTKASAKKKTAVVTKPAAPAAEIVQVRQLDAAPANTVASR